MMEILLASTSQLKYDMVEIFFKKVYPDIKCNITKFDCSELKLPAQPINCGSQCAKARLNYVKSKVKSMNQNVKFDYIISIENSVDVSKTEDDCDALCDVCHVVIEHQYMISYSQNTIAFELNFGYVGEFQLQELKKYNNNIAGYDITFGEIMHKYNNKIDPKNWLKGEYYMDRTNQIMDSIESAFRELKRMEKDKLDILDFCNYRMNIMSVLKNKDLLQKLVNILISRYRYDDIDYVIASDHEGIFLGGILAYELNCGYFLLEDEIFNNIPKNSKILLISNITDKEIFEQHNKLDCELVDYVCLHMDSEFNDSNKFKYTILL